MTGVYFVNNILAALDSCVGKLSRALLSRSWSFVIPTIREQIAQTLSTATVGSLTLEEA
ncbi:hypothetical protein H4S04_009017, partial [Coemansia sp. S16]